MITFFGGIYLGYEFYTLCCRAPSTAVMRICGLFLYMLVLG